MKRFLSLFLALATALALTVPAFAAEPGGGEDIIEPRSTYLSVDEPVTNVGSRWTQPANYKYYRVWVQNTSTTDMLVTLTYPNGTQETKILPADPNYNNRVLFESSNAAAGLYRIGFSNGHGNVSGTVRVRVANEPLSLAAVQPAESVTLTAPVMFAAFNEGEGDIQPRSMISIIDHPIRPSGYWWDTPSAAYKYYRVWVQNTTETRMAVTLTHPDGRQETKRINAGEANVLFTSSSATLGEYRVDFGVDLPYTVAGFVKVTVSDRPIT